MSQSARVTEAVATVELVTGAQEIRLAERTGGIDYSLDFESVTFLLHIYGICSRKPTNANSTPTSRQRATRNSQAGADIHGARRRRRLPTAVVAERAFTSRSTLQRVEAGDTSVSLGIYASVLHALGLLEGLSNAADIGTKFSERDRRIQHRTWEEIALRLARQAGIATPQHALLHVAGKAVMLSRRFDRRGMLRIPFLSTIALTGASDGERGSYPEIVDALAQYGAQGRTDAHALYRRVVFNVLISNVDDHLRNHGLLWHGRAGWTLSPAYDLNPVPTDLKARVLTRNIDLDEGTCSLDLLESASQFFGLTLAGARHHQRGCGGDRDLARYRESRGRDQPRSTVWRALSSMAISGARSLCDDTDGSVRRWLKW